VQCVAVCFSVLQCVAVWCIDPLASLDALNVCNTLQCVAVFYDVLQCMRVCCSVLHCVALWCSVLQTDVV